MDCDEVKTKLLENSDISMSEEPNDANFGYVRGKQRFVSRRNLVVIFFMAFSFSLNVILVVRESISHQRAHCPSPYSNHLSFFCLKVNPLTPPKAACHRTLPHYTLHKVTIGAKMTLSRTKCGPLSTRIPSRSPFLMIMLSRITFLRVLSSLGIQTSESTTLRRSIKCIAL